MLSVYVPRSHATPTGMRAGLSHPNGVEFSSPGLTPWAWSLAQVHEASSPCLSLTTQSSLDCGAPAPLLFADRSTRGGSRPRSEGKQSGAGAPQSKDHARRSGFGGASAGWAATALKQRRAGQRGPRFCLGVRLTEGVHGLYILVI